MTKRTAWAGIVLALVAFGTMIVGLIQQNFALLLIGAGVIVALRVAVWYVRRSGGDGSVGPAR